MAEDGDTIDCCALSTFLLEQTAQHRGLSFHACTLCALLSFQVLRNLVGRRWWHSRLLLCCQCYHPPITPRGENASVMVAAVSVRSLGGFFSSFCRCCPDCLPRDLNDGTVIAKESSQTVRYVGVNKSTNVRFLVGCHCCLSILRAFIFFLNENIIYVLSYIC